MSKGKNAVLYKKTLPIAGESGTVSSLCKGTVAQGRVYAKSGTMNRIKSYSGYIDALSGKKLAFAIIVNNFTCSSSTTTEQIEKLLVEIVKGN